MLKLCDCHSITEDGAIYAHKLSRFLKFGNDGRGYYQTILHGKAVKPHRLVAIHFIPNPSGLLQVNHKDGNKHNNHVSNLEWVTQTENIRHAIRTGLLKLSGESHPRAKLTAEKVAQIRSLHSQGIGSTRLGRRFGVNQSHIKRIVSGKSWL